MKKGSLEEQILRASKEVAVKFIEVGRLSPSSFPETFKTIWDTIASTVQAAADNASDDTEGTG